MRDGSAEEGDHGVADELLDGAAEALELTAQTLMVGSEQGPHVLRIHLLGSGSEADEVGEEHGDDLPLLTRGRRIQRDSAGEAEPRSLGILLPAARTDKHAEKRRRIPRRREVRPVAGAHSLDYLQPGNLNETMRVCHAPKIRSVPRYSCAYQNVQSSVGSTVRSL